ncbi:transposase [Candidatus Bathyarchaeota archaeon]|nr:transposase [Candidatus Bathyarchaeota archaeon]
MNLAPSFKNSMVSLPFQVMASMARAVLVDHAVKVRIYPNAAQVELLSKTFDCKRWIGTIGWKNGKHNIQEKTTAIENKISAFDMSCTEFMVGTGTEAFTNPRFYRTHENKLKKLHRELSRKQKGSSNRNKARVKVARFYGKIGDRRTNWQQKLSTELVNRHDAIVNGDLNFEGMKRFNGGISNMSRSNSHGASSFGWWTTSASGTVIIS